jgi:hypothetical protein
MPPNTLSHSLPLPRGWPRRVRSAVVQVISLVRTSLALTEGWASESMNPELRQQAEEDRLQQEVQLLLSPPGSDVWGAWRARMVSLAQYTSAVQDCL